MSIIAGYSERLSAELTLSASSEDQIALNAIHDRALHMTDLVNDVLVLDRIEQKLRDIRWQRLSLSKLVRDVVAMWRSRAAAQDIQLEVHTEGDFPEIEADVELLREALQVLLERTLDVTATGTDVNVRLFAWDRWSVVRFEYLSAKAPSTNLLSRQKTPSKSTTTPDLQLALARLIAEGHGGHLSVEENGSQGSAISLWLLQKPDRGSAKEDASSENVHPGSDWLIVGKGSIRVNTASQQVWLDKEPVSLSGGEYRLLLHLGENADQAVSYEQIAMAVWAQSDSESIHRLRVLVSRLRQKLDVDQNGSQYLQTVRGFGYMLIS